MKQSHAWTRRAALAAYALLGSLLPGCSSDICEGISQSCLSVRLEAGSDQSSDRLRVLVGIDGSVPVERVSKPPGGTTGAASFPITFSVLLGDRGGRVDLDVIAELAGSPRLRAQGGDTVPAGQHKRLTLNLSSDIGNAATLSSGIPAARHSAGLAYFPERRSLIMFGGIDAGTKPLDDTWEFLAAEKRWQPLRGLNHPSARAGQLAYHARRRAIALFGGQAPDGSSKSLDDLWVLDQTGAWSSINQPTAPSPRSGSALAYDRRTDTLVLYGGRNASQPQPLSDVWELVGDSSTWAPRTLSTAAPVVANPRMVFDGRYVLLIGSDEANPTTLKVWRLDTIFTELPPPGGNTAPIRRNDFAVSFDLSNSALLLFGGTTAGAPLAEALTWSPIDYRWTPLTTAATPAARSAAAMAYAPELNGSLLVAGKAADGSPLSGDDNWQFSAGAWNSLKP
ncbi:MAG TPA: kelch repeat-containing protein [Pseudomonadota bacterium]|nr:kelch repeat-containing protein [Pseudomonadota bacterium]